MIAGLEFETALIVLAIYLLGGVVKGIFGFGLPIITMALLPFVVSVEKAIVLSAVVQPVTNILQLVTAGGVMNSLRLVWPVLVTLIPGILVGVWFLSSLDAGILLLIVGITISAYAIYDLTGYGFRIQEKNRLPTGLGFGFLAGIFGVLTAVNGWAFILFILGLGKSRNEFRSAIALLFLISGFLISSSFYAVGFLTPSLLLLSIVALVPCFAGMWFGNQLGEWFEAGTFRRLLLIALVIVGCVLAYRGYTSIG